MRSRALPAALAVAALVCLGLALYFATQKTSLFASSFRIHRKYAVGFGGLGVLAAIAAVSTYRREA